MIDTAHVKEQIRGFIVTKSPIARKRRIQNDDPLLESGILDSLGVLDLLGFIEEAFSVSFGDDELVPENFQTINRLAAYIERRRAAKPGCVA